MGSYESALEAGKRKGAGKLYLHKCAVDTAKEVPVLDCGNAELWESEIRFSSSEGDTLVYNNKYEPSIHPSYVIMKESTLQSIEIIEVQEYVVRRN